MNITWTCRNEAHFGYKVNKVLALDYFEKGKFINISTSLDFQKSGKYEILKLWSRTHKNKLDCYLCLHERLLTDYNLCYLNSLELYSLIPLSNSNNTQFAVINLVRKLAKTALSLRLRFFRKITELYTELNQMGANWSKLSYWNCFFLDFSKTKFFFIKNRSISNCLF